MLVFKPLEGRLEDIAKDYKANWMTQVTLRLFLTLPITYLLHDIRIYFIVSLTPYLLSFYYVTNILFYQCEILDDDTFIGAEHFNNVFVCTKEGGADDEDRRLVYFVLLRIFVSGMDPWGVHASPNAFRTVV